ATGDELVDRAILDPADDRAPALRIDPDRESLVLDRGAIHGVPPGISPGSGYRDGPIGSVAKRRDVTRDEGKPRPLQRSIVAPTCRLEHERNDRAGIVPQLDAGVRAGRPVECRSGDVGARPGQRVEDRAGAPIPAGVALGSSAVAGGGAGPAIAAR